MKRTYGKMKNTKMPMIINTKGTYKEDVPGLALNIVGEMHPLLTLPVGILPIFNGNSVMFPEKHLDQFINICEIHSIIEDDVMVRVFLQTLVGQAYEWYLGLPHHSISSFDDMQYAFLFYYSHHVPYYTLLTDFTQIHLKKMKNFEI